MKQFYNLSIPSTPSKFAASFPWVECNRQGSEIYVYHGTSSYRRWEIGFCGFLQPGRGNLTFLTTDANEAWAYAQAACLRDVNIHSTNSLVAQPVVLRIKLTYIEWEDIYFLQTSNFDQSVDEVSMNIAVLGPISAANIVGIKQIGHADEIFSPFSPCSSVRSFEDGKVLSDIKRLRMDIDRWRADKWAAQKLLSAGHKVNVVIAEQVAGVAIPEITPADELRRLRDLNL